MTSWRHQAVSIVGRMLKIHIVRRGQAWALLELDNLAQFLDAFEVDCVFDVGANTGQYARRLRELGYRGFIISVEPIPKLAAALKRAAHSDGRWLVEATALSEETADVPFHVMANTQFSSLRTPDHSQTRLFEQMNAVTETLSIKTERLESLYDKYQAQLGFAKPFLKMDTQGNDLAVARGAGERLSDFVGLQSEIAFARLYTDQCGYREALDFYSSAGFILSSLVPNNAGHFPNLIEMDCIMYNETLLDGARNLKNVR